jgi:hypothetical protein
LVIIALNIKESNEIFRLAIIRNYFEPELIKMDYQRSVIKHPLSKENGLNKEDLLHLFFDISTGNDYPDGDEWFTIEYIIAQSIKLPDSLKGPDYFTTLSVPESQHLWRHRELVRFKYGKSKKLSESLIFIDRKYRDLLRSLRDSSVVGQIDS